jgi:tRNA A-37 threonylcarbamoyl transferase component Bud32
LYFVNWQREVFVEEREGRKVVVKRNKTTKEFHEFLITYVYSVISILLACPARPTSFLQIETNEGPRMRKNLAEIGIPTPRLLDFGEAYLVEEYVEGGDLYLYLAYSGAASFARQAGALTGRLHNAGYCFIDNKAQNYLVDGDRVLRTDLGFIQLTSSVFARSMDIGSFLASIMDLHRYSEIEEAFYLGYVSEVGKKFTYRSIVIRNLLSLGFSSDSLVMLKNMILDSIRLLEG